MQRKRSRRRRRERVGDESKTAIDSPIVGGTRTGNGTGNGGDGGGGGGNDVVNVNGIAGDGSGDHHHRTDAIDDGLEKNPDIIPHDNGKEYYMYLTSKKRTRPHNINISIVSCE